MLKILRRCCSSMAAAAEKATRPISLNKISLTGRDLIRPSSLSTDEYKSLLWTALDLKACDQRHDVARIEDLSRARLSLVLNEPSMITQFSVQNAAKFFKMGVNTVVLGHENLGNDYVEIGSMLNSMSDIIICHIDSQEHLEKVRDIANCPVVGIKSDKFSMIDVLTHLMTIQETYKHLRYIKFSWIGEQGPLINTYMCMLPKFAINFKYVCVDSAAACVSPSLLQTGMRISQEMGSELHEYMQPKDALTRAQVIATNPHNQEKLKIQDFQISKAAAKWSLIDSYPRQNEVDYNVYNHKNSLVYTNIKNLQWIYAAILIRFLRNYCHQTEEPSFDDFESSYEKFHF